MREYHARLLEPLLREALEDTPVELVNGARQTGKTTLVKRTATARPLPDARRPDRARRGERQLKAA